jgi:Lrp/AsnC family transcriptional regulator, leucine-responsive regulatory protein
VKERLDKSDRQILKLLQQDGRISNADLARKIGLSPPSMLQRVRKLETAGYVKGYSTRLNAEKLGFTLDVIAMISLSMHQDQPIDQFIENILEVPEVLACYHVSGDYDFMLRIVAKDMHDYERILKERLASIKAVGKIHSCFVLNVNKETEVLPI